MAVTAAKAGLVETTITTGTGAYALLGGLTPPWRGFIAADDGQIFGIGIYQDGVGFEEGEYTYNHGARTLARTTVLANHLGTQAPIDWGAGSKEVSNVITSSRAVQTTVENKFLADQFLRSFKLFLDSGDTTWLVAASNIFRIFLASAEVFKLEAGKLTFTWSDSTATEGPELKLARVSSSAAINDALAVLRMTGSDTAQNEITALKIRPTLLAVTPGAHSSRVAFDIAKAGALQPILQLQPDTVSVQAGVTFFSAGKTISALNTVGAEFANTGEVVGVTQDAPAAQFYRKGSDGLVIEIGKDGVAQGGIQCLAGVVSISGASMSHPAEWAPDVVGGEAFESLGWVVSTAEGLREDESNRHPLVRPSQSASDPCVHGVVTGRFDGKLLIEASGAGLIRCIGTVNRGNLLETSATEGCAQAQAGTALLSSTVAKATQSSPDTGQRLVPCMLLG